MDDAQLDERMGKSTLANEVERLQRELHDERVRRDEWEKMYNRALVGTERVAGIQEAVKWLWGFWDGNSLVAIKGFEDDIHDAWSKLLEVALGGH